MYGEPKSLAGGDIAIDMFLLYVPTYKTIILFEIYIYKTLLNLTTEQLSFNHDGKCSYCQHCQ